MIKKVSCMALLSGFVNGAYSGSFAFGLVCIPLRQGLFNQTSIVLFLALSVILLMVFEWEGNKLIKTAGIIFIIFLVFPVYWSSISLVSIRYSYIIRFIWF